MSLAHASFTMKSGRRRVPKAQRSGLKGTPGPTLEEPGLGPEGPGGVPQQDTHLHPPSSRRLGHVVHGHQLV